MTKQELIAALENVSDDAVVRVKDQTSLAAPPHEITGVESDGLASAVIITS